jgi:hypothetical protein
MLCLSQYYVQRPWNGNFMHFIFFDPRLNIMYIFLAYWLKRYYWDRNIEADEFDRLLIERWGGTLEEVRKNLSPGDQVRARVQGQIEKSYSVFIKPPRAPPGMNDLPLPTAHAHH